MLTVALILVFLTCGIFALRRRNGNKDEPPPLPGALPLIGHLHIFYGNSSNLWSSFKKCCYDSFNTGGVVSVYFGPTRVAYFVTDPDDCLKIANTCLQKDRFYEFLKPWFGEGLITGDLPIYKLHRKLLNPAFNQSVIEGFIDIFNRQARRLVKALEAEVDKGPFDHLVYILRNGLETICQTVLAVDFSDEHLLNSEYVQASEKILQCIIERFQKPWLHSDVIFKWSALKRKQDECLKILHNMSDTVLKKRKAEYLKNKKYQETKDTTKDQFRPFIDLLLELSIEKGALNDREIREHVDTILFSGHDTSATVLTYTILMIGSYPEVQKKIFEELHDVFGDDERDVTKQDLSQLVYLEAVLKETIRLYTVGPFIARHLDQDVKLRNYMLSKGRTCFLAAYGAHRHHTWGPDAEEFKPERWLNSDTLPECPAAFGGFGMGRRLCIGKSYILMSMKITLSHVLRHYRVCGNHLKMVAKLDILLKPVSGHHVSIEMRKNKLSQNYLY